MKRTALLLLLTGLWSGPAPAQDSGERPYIDESHPDYYARRYWRNYRDYWGFKHPHTWNDPELRDGPLTYDENAITERLLRGEDARDVFRDVPGTRKPGGIRSGRGPIWSESAGQSAPAVPSAGPVRIIRLKNDGDKAVEFSFADDEAGAGPRTLQPGEAGLRHAKGEVEIRFRSGGETRALRLSPGMAYGFTQSGGRWELQPAGKAESAPGSGRSEPEIDEHPYAQYRDAAIIKISAPEGAFVSFEYPDGKSRMDLPRGTGAFRAIVERPRDGTEAVTLSIRVEAEVRGLARGQRTQFVTVPIGKQVELEIKPNAGGNGLRVLWW